jgi:hypothetical protein
MRQSTRRLSAWRSPEKKLGVSLVDDVLEEVMNEIAVSFRCCVSTWVELDFWIKRPWAGLPETNIRLVESLSHSEHCCPIFWHRPHWGWFSSHFTSRYQPAERCRIYKTIQISPSCDFAYIVSTRNDSFYDTVVVTFPARTVGTALGIVILESWNQCLVDISLKPWSWVRRRDVDGHNTLSGSKLWWLCDLGSLVFYCNKK